MLIHWIWLATRPALHDRDKVALLTRFHDPEELFFADKASIAAIEGITQEAMDALNDKNLIPAEEILSECDDKKIHILTYQDAAYPRKLKNITDPPLVLYYKGRLPDLDGNPVIGVVGTRKASGYGLTVAKRMGYQIAACGGIVVSGMAFGIDGMAMAGALTAGEPVVGILGCGVDVVYPLSNRALYQDTENNGCLISEFLPGTPPFKWNFPKRNRLISGLSNGVLVIEAPVRSGSLITANQAADQGRDVFVVPGNIDVPTCAGSNALLREGAISVTTGWDVISEYEALYPERVKKNTAPARLTAYPDEVARANETDFQPLKVAEKSRVPKKDKVSKPKKEKKVIDKEPASSYIDFNDKIQSLPEDQKTVANLLLSGEKLVDDVVASSGLPTGKVLAILTLLEIKGIVTRLPGKRVALHR